MKKEYKYHECCDISTLKKYIIKFFSQKEIKNNIQDLKNPSKSIKFSNI